MPDYQKGKIYQIISPNHPLPYIGSTTQPLCVRITQHRSKRSKCRSRIVLDAGDAYIELIEDFPCQNKEQLNKREGEIMRERDCVNYCIAGRTQKMYYEEHRNTILEYVKEYNKAHIDKIKAYREANKEKRKEVSKQYYIDNKEAIAERKRKKRLSQKFGV